MKRQSTSYKDLNINLEKLFGPGSTYHLTQYGDPTVHSKNSSFDTILSNYNFPRNIVRQDDIVSSGVSFFLRKNAITEQTASKILADNKIVKTEVGIFVVPSNVDERFIDKCVSIAQQLKERLGLKTISSNPVFFLTNDELCSADGFATNSELAIISLAHSEDTALYTFTHELVHLFMCQKCGRHPKNKMLVEGVAEYFSNAGYFQEYQDTGPVETSAGQFGAYFSVDEMLLYFDGKNPSELAINLFTYGYGRHFVQTFVRQFQTVEEGENNLIKLYTEAADLKNNTSFRSDQNVKLPQSSLFLRALVSSFGISIDKFEEQLLKPQVELTRCMEILDNYFHAANKIDS